MTDLSRMSDAALWKQVIDETSEAAFHTLMDRHRSMVWGVCSRFLCAGDADDAFQMSVIALLEHGNQIRSPDFGPWLYRVAYRAALRVRSDNLGSEQLVDKDTAGELSAADDVFQQIARTERLELIEEAIDSLPEKYREVVILHYGRGLRRDDVADRLNLTVQTVKARLARGRDALRSRLLRRGVSLSLAAMFLDTLVQGADVPADLEATTWKVVQRSLAGESIGYSKAQFSDFPQTEYRMDLLRGMNPKWTVGAVIAAIAMLVVFEAGRISGSGHGTVASMSPARISTELPLPALQPVDDEAPEVEPVPLTLASTADWKTSGASHDASHLSTVSFEQTGDPEEPSANAADRPDAVDRRIAAGGDGGLPSGKWVRTSILGTVAFDVDHDQVRVDFEGSGDLAQISLSMQGEFTTASDGTVYGLFHGLDLKLDETLVDENLVDESSVPQLLMVTSMLNDLPFAMRVHSVRDAMIVKKLTVGIPIASEDHAEMGAMGVYAAMVCGSYSPDDQ